VTASSTRSPLDFDDLDGAIAAIRESGLRFSSARRLVLESLFAAEGPMSAEDIATGVGGAPPSDLASVYRNLETLERLGLVRHVHLGHGPGLYALTGGGEREYVVCEGCGAFQALPPRRLDGVREAVRQAVGYEARFTHFPIVGLCAVCADRPAGEQPAAEES
jgi:Fur family ferric uptake transcriptional regulator